MSNQLICKAGLKIPVIDLGLAESGEYLSEPEIIQDSLLELLGTENDLSSLVIVKLDEDPGKELKYEDPESAEQIYLNQLDKVEFNDNIKRGVVLSSGNSVYFGNKELIAKIRDQFFKTQPDHCCRYGSLLVSSCLQGATLFDSNQSNSTIRLKIVDSQSKDPKEKAEAAAFSTGDCHGKISPQLAEQIGAKSNHPFQFRMAWMTNWNDKKTEHSSPKTSFLAKGTFLPNRSLTEDRGYDIVLDRSSIKGIAKDQLNELIPCGDYQLPKMALGNRANAELQKYDNSWQFNVWFSEKAISSDIVPATKTEAQRLGEIQSNPLKLNRYIVEQHDLKASFIQGDDDAVNVEQNDAPEPKESKLVSLIRKDTKGLLTEYPKIVDFQRSQLRKFWLNLASKGALHHDSAMAQPCDNLKPGTIVAPHLKDKTEVIVTRYPIVSKDNIRRYTVDNQQTPAKSLLNYRGCVFIRPDQAMQHHQCDFDGDQLVVTPAARFPKISQEVRQANEPAEYPSVVKRDKTDYKKPKYTNLKQIAAAIKQNSIGYVATLIGRVQSSSNPYQKPSRRSKFESAKRQLLGKLFDALQIEVDSPKSATRYQDHHEDLIALTNKWVNKFPSPLFDYKKDERVYRTGCLPSSVNNNINCITREAVNPQWSQTKLKSSELNNFSFLMGEPESKEDLTYWEQVCLPKAEEIKQKYIESVKEIHQTNKNDPEQKKEKFAQLYESLRTIVNEEFPDAEERMLAASAMWKLETSNKSLKNHIAECKKLSCKLSSTIELVEEHKFAKSLEPQATWVVSIPFVRQDNSQTNRNADYRPLAAEFKDYLNNKGVNFEATVNSDLPLIGFALIDPQSELLETLQNTLGDNNNDRFLMQSLMGETPKTALHRFLWQEQNLTTYQGNAIPLRIVPPKDYTWVEVNEDNLAKGSLVLNLFSEEICQRLEEYQVNSLTLIGAKYNDYNQVDFSDKRLKDKEFKFVVGKFNNPNDYRHGKPMVQLKNKNLAMFAPQSPKLPIGSSFIGCIEQNKGTLILHVKPESILLPDNELPPKHKIINKQNTKLKRKFYVSNQSKLSINQKANNKPSNKRKRNFSLNIEIPNSTVEAERKKDKTKTQPDIKQLFSQNGSTILHQSIKAQHQKTQKNQLRIDSKGEWITTIKNNKCQVYDQNKKIIFQSNLLTDKIEKPLSEANAERFFKICEQEAKKENLTPKKINQHKRKTRQGQLSI